LTTLSDLSMEVGKRLRRTVKNWCVICRNMVVNWMVWYTGWRGVDQRRNFEGYQSRLEWTVIIIKIVV